MLADAEITANYAINTHTLDITIIGNGSVTKDPDKAAYEHGETVEIIASPDTGYHFVNWSGDVPPPQQVGSSAYITMDSDKFS